ncbi:MAG: tRNA (guanosine(37)-N1)-methyltransferase TrmD [Rickettsiales bacterium]|jgi:tRNA (guanine37-N1)-methyltransferase|nr:tRNA (guanosine(37)-N1)-methyltransferase TrmD [Rickettsiales bacterium]
MTKINILTLFPDMFSPLYESITGRAIRNGSLALDIINIRDFAQDNYKTVDDAPYGGGAGQLLKPDVLGRAIDSAHGDEPVYLLSPRGERFAQATAARLAKMPEITFVCGHYEGVDERVIEYYKMREISLGDFVTSGGETALIPMIDALARLIPGVLGSDESLSEESFSEALGGGMEYPQYTRPEEWRGMRVPEVLLSGHHKNIKEWQKSKVRKPRGDE